MAGHSCRAENEKGEPRRQAPLQDGELCFWHSPEHAEEVAEAGRLGGLRRRGDKTVAAAYDLDGLGSLEQIRRLLEIAAMDTLGLENSIARSRALAYLAQVSLKLTEVGDFQERLRAGASARWQELLAAETVIEEAAAEFDGEDPLLPAAREMLTRVRSELEELVRQLRERLAGLEFGEPGEEMLDELRKSLGLPSPS